MKNIKIEKALTGHQYWPTVPNVKVKKDEAASKWPKTYEKEEELEGVIQTWEKVAVLKTSPNVPFKIGYIHGDSIHYLKETIETRDGMFGMRIGDDDARFFILPEGLDQDMELEVVEVTKGDNPKYKDLPLY